MNLVKLKKEKLEADYTIKKIENIIENDENLEEYILLIENNKQDSPNKLQKKILEKINDVNVTKEVKYKTDDIEDIKDIKNIENIINKEYTSFNIRRNGKIESNDKVIKRLERKFIDVIKIVACTIFALLIWEMTPTNITYAQNSVKVEETEKTKENKTESANKIGMNRKVSNFFMKPISIERGER